MHATVLRLVVLYADVSGSTRIYEQYGDTIARTDISVGPGLLSDAASAHEGKTIKTIGDEINGGILIMNEFKQKYGPWALITGASSGIGMEFARQLAERGLNLVLVARREDKLKTLATELGNKFSIETRVVTTDLSRDDFLPMLKNSVSNLEIGLLVNNAGLTTTGPIVDNALADELNLLYLNCRAPLILAHEFGKHMRDRKRGGIIFLGSVLSFASVPYWANYAASKAYDLMLAEGLAAEMKEHHVDVLALCPGFTRTEFAEFAKLNDLMAMDVQPVVKYALCKLGKSRIAIPGIMNKLNSLSTRSLPRFLNTLIFGAVVRSTQRLNQ